MAEADDFPNVDAHKDAGDGETKAARALWVRVANSTENALAVETFTHRAQRQEVQGMQTIWRSPVDGTPFTTVGCPCIT